MARRSPSNPRYQKGASIGKTRRSAASAKPTRGAGADSKKASTRKKRRSILAPVPSDPEFRRWRKIWLGALGAAIVFSGFAWWQQGTWPGTAVLILAYACIFTAFYVDFRKMRPLRKAAIEAERDEKNGSSK